MSETSHANPYTAPSSVLDEVEPEETGGPKLASIGSRFAASVIDHVLVAGPPVFAIFYAPYRTNASLDLTNPASLGLGFSLAIVFAVAVLACNLFLLRMTGQTIGKKLLGIKLVRGDGHSYVSVWRIVGLRFLPVFFASRWIPVAGQAIWGVEALTIFGRDRKCIHDYLADTIVITEDGAAAPENEEKSEREPEVVARDLGETRTDHLVVVATVHGPVEAALAQGWLEA